MLNSWLLFPSFPVSFLMSAPPPSLEHTLFLIVTDDSEDNNTKNHNSLPEFEKKTKSWWDRERERETSLRWQDHNNQTNIKMFTYRNFFCILVFVQLFLTIQGFISFISFFDSSSCRGRSFQLVVFSIRTSTHAYMPLMFPHLSAMFLTSFIFYTVCGLSQEGNKVVNLKTTLLLLTFMCCSWQPSFQFSWNLYGVLSFYRSSMQSCHMLNRFFWQICPRRRKECQ